ncbi:proteasome subunit beta type-2 isoform X2 [Bombyx mori]|uniref:proteasome subunit beta type-2 isoform X2 n=1 Tax=Bombyx mori TaxID=7091 RepID=UPI002ED2F29E
MTNPSTSLYLQCLIGIQCQDFVLVAADQTNIQSIIVMSDDEDKLHNISNSLVMGVIGDHADAVHLQQYITKNLQLYKLKNGYELDTPAVVHFTRRTLSDSLKNGKNWYPPEIRTPVHRSTRMDRTSYPLGHDDDKSVFTLWLPWDYISWINEITAHLVLSSFQSVYITTKNR